MRMRAPDGIIRRRTRKAHCEMMKRNPDRVPRKGTRLQARSRRERAMQSDYPRTGVPRNLHG